jgi:hypothetical protein
VASAHLAGSKWPNFDVDSGKEAQQCCSHRNNSRETRNGEGGGRWVRGNGGEKEEIDVTSVYSRGE